MSRLCWRRRRQTSAFSVATFFVLTAAWRAVADVRNATRALLGEPHAATIASIIADARDVRYVDLDTRGGSGEPPWFDGFRAEGAYVATLSHPAHRVVQTLLRSGAESIAKGMAWLEEGKPAGDDPYSQQGYQMVDNFLVRVLGGKAVWDLPPRGVGEEHLRRAKAVLGKFDVIMRAECLRTDGSQFSPFVPEGVGATGLLPPDRNGRDKGSLPSRLSPETGNLELAEQSTELMLANELDLELWTFAEQLVNSRSVGADTYLCGADGTTKSLPFEGRSAVVYNSKIYHVEVTTPLACSLKSLGFDTTVIMSAKFPRPGYMDLLAPCAHRVLRPPPGGADDVASVAAGLPGGKFDVAALTTAVQDAPALLEEDGGMRRAVLEDTETLVLVKHHVSNVATHRYPPEFVEFGTQKGWALLLGEHTRKWAAIFQESVQSPTRFYRHLAPPWYPVHPAGMIGGATPKATASQEKVFLIQGQVAGTKRAYPELLRCLEAMCADGRGDFVIKQVGAAGELPEMAPCLAERFRSGGKMGYLDFYREIRQAHFVVTATATPLYNWERATSSVPTALLLERPLVASASLLRAYPCLRDSPVHAAVASDDLCQNVANAYELTPERYDEMELEARECKAQLWAAGRAAMARIASGTDLEPSSDI